LNLGRKAPMVAQKIEPDGRTPGDFEARGCWVNTGLAGGQLYPDNGRGRAGGTGALE